MPFKKLFGRGEPRHDQKRNISTNRNLRRNKANIASRTGGMVNMSNLQNMLNLQRWATEYCQQNYGTPEFKPFLEACEKLWGCQQ